MPTAGNAGGTWSLYAARAGIDITVTMAKSAPIANQTEVLTAGGELVLVDGSIADAGTRAKEISEETGAFLATTFNEPYRMEGKKAAWFEVFDRMGDAATGMSMPKTIVLPVGGGVAAIAAAKAAEEVRAAGWTSDDLARLIGVQPTNCAPIVRAYESGSDEVDTWTSDPYTIAAGLRVPAPAEGALVLQTVRASGGAMVDATEEEILASVRHLASTEGVFACPEGAASLAAARKLADRDELEGPVLLYNTGSGAKYVDALSEP
jgi:threonine synthase